MPLILEHAKDSQRELEQKLLIVNDSLSNDGIAINFLLLALKIYPQPQNHLLKNAGLENFLLKISKIADQSNDAQNFPSVVSDLNRMLVKCNMHVQELNNKKVT